MRRGDDLSTFPPLACGIVDFKLMRCVRVSAAFASPATRHLYLDGSFDLAQDVVSGGFTLTDGVMRTVDAPGLGVTRL